MGNSVKIEPESRFTYKLTQPVAINYEQTAPVEAASPSAPASTGGSSLAHYRVAEVFFLQNNYESAGKEYHEAINGDNDPKWTVVWAHIKLGNIFDVSGQRDRAVNEYRLAVQTNDNTQGAVNEARQDLQKPFAACTTEQ